jgi:crotonobetainyl-CoA:carnitine CoA-transferase CaiB-like acyl-CoA transferase
LAALLQGNGIEAFAVQDFAGVLADPQLRERDHFVAMDHPAIGRHAYERSSFRMSTSPGMLASPGPRLGQHTDFVMGELLGIDNVELHRLRSMGVLE